jgi:hypothetical protein
MSALVLSGNPVMLTSGLPRALNNMYVNRLPKEYLFNAYRSLLGIPYRGKWPGVQKRVELDNEEVVNKVQAFFECGREKALAHMNEGIYDIDMICEYYDVFIKHFLPD